jgi:ABC-2 type transport system ATP-binding protein
MCMLGDGGAPADPGEQARGHRVLRAEELRKSFHRGIWPRLRTVRALDGASLEVCAGEPVGLVGRTARARAR